jgi:hypothetical protein
MVGSLRLGHLEAEGGTKHIQGWRVGGAFSPGTTRVAVGGIAVAARNYGESAFAFREAVGRAEEGLGVLGYA